MRAVLALVAVLTCGPGAAACETMGDMLEANVVGVPDGATLILSSGEKVRLSGIQAPKLFSGENASMNWPLAEDAKAALDRLAAGRSIALGAGTAARDRHGRLIGQAYLDDGTWLQQAMVAAGMARAYSFADNRLCAGALLRAEAAARAEKRGLWAYPFYAIRDAARPADILGRAGYYELVEGRVLLADRVGASVYLNFGRYWKEDTTVTIDKAALKLFAAAGFDPMTLEGALIRVRGWIEANDGPRIAVTHPEQIEVLAQP
ncbi:MAG: thermonuclease family protein [Alphaproteobacteria bacterium]|nr:thermonuclease family protein [Alphaproteobacteria bacterium]